MRAGRGVGVGTRGRICLTWVKKNQAWDMSSRETRINVYKFSGQIHLLEYSRNFRYVGSNFKVGKNIRVRGYF